MALSLEGIKNTASSLFNTAYDNGAYLCSKTAEMGRSFFSSLYSSARSNPKTTAGLVALSSLGIVAYRNRGTLSGMVKAAYSYGASFFAAKKEENKGETMKPNGEIEGKNSGTDLTDKATDA